MRLKILHLINSNRSDIFWRLQNFEELKTVDVRHLEDAVSMKQENQIVYLPYEPAVTAVPVPGDIVLSGNDRVGIIGGVLDQAKTEYLIGFNMVGVYRNSRLVDPGNGGPALYISAAELINQNDRVLYQFWDWKRGYAGAGLGASYWAEAALWRWEKSVGA